MAVTNFIPSIWNAALLSEFRQQAIMAALTNREYEGDAQKGNTVKITTAVPVVVKDYKANKRKTTPDDLSTTQIDLVIDQEKNFDFLIDDIDRVQTAGTMTEFARSAAYGLVEDADKWIAAQMVASTLAPAKITRSITTAAAAWDAVRDLRKVLTKNLVPVGNRVLVINAEFEALLLGNDSKITSVDLSGSPAGLREAVLGRILGFEVYTSENLPVVDRPQALAFHKSAYGFVNQITETEGMRANDTFADRLRGLNVYGGVAVRPKALATFTGSGS